jgi:hypothetical protein
VFVGSPVFWAVVAVAALLVIGAIAALVYRHRMIIEYIEDEEESPESGLTSMLGTRLNSWGEFQNPIAESDNPPEAAFDGELDD